MTDITKKNSWATKAVKYFKQGLDIKGVRKDFAAKNASIIGAAQMEYKKKYGEEMSPSYLEANLESGWLDKKSKDYLKIKNRIRKEVT